MSYVIVPVTDADRMQRVYTCQYDQRSVTADGIIELLTCPDDELWACGSWDVVPDGATYAYSLGVRIADRGGTDRDIFIASYAAGVEAFGSISPIVLGPGSSLVAAITGFVSANNLTTMLQTDIDVCAS